MTRGRGVILQKYKDGGLSRREGLRPCRGPDLEDAASAMRTETDLKDWIGKRAQAGRLPPRGFATNNKFG